MAQKIQKVLVGCPTYDGQKHCIDRFMHALKKLTYKNFDVLFVDNSETDEFAQRIRKEGYEVIRNPIAEEKIVRIVSNRNKIIERMLLKKYDCLFFADTDVLLPEDAIENLLIVNQAIVSGVYLSGLKFSEGIKIAPVLYDFSEQEDYVQIVPMNEVMDDKIFEIAACGFGCCLIKREVIEKVKIRYSEKSKGGEDLLFCNDARKNFGYKTVVNTAVKCVHMTPAGDVEFPAGLANFSLEYDMQ